MYYPNSMDPNQIPLPGQGQMQGQMPGQLPPHLQGQLPPHMHYPLQPMMGMNQMPLMPNPVVHRKYRPFYTTRSFKNMTFVNDDIAFDDCICRTAATTDRG
jgi:hypothetical protein